MVWPRLTVFCKENPSGYTERKKRKQKKRWEDNIKAWTGMDFASSTRAAENMTRRKGVDANSSVVFRYGIE